MNPYQQNIDLVVTFFETNVVRGLSKKQVNKRLTRDGYNVLPDVKRRSLFSIFISQFKSPLIYILFIASIIIFIVGDDKIDAFIISGVLLFNAILGAI